MDKLVVVSAKIPEELYKEMVLRVSEGERSDFIREAILEKLQKIPRPDKIFELEKKVTKLETELSEIKKILAGLEILTYGTDKVNPYAFGIDEIDRKIIDYLLHYKGATTPELANHIGTNRWQILNRLRRIQKTSKRELGKPLIEFYGGEKSGKKKAWWINEEIIET